MGTNKPSPDLRTINDLFYDLNLSIYLCLLFTNNDVLLKMSQPLIWYIQDEGFQKVRSFPAYVEQSKYI